MIDFVDVAHKVDDIAAASGKLDKEYLLKKYADTEGFKEILQFIFDPYFTTGLKANKLYRIDCGEYAVPVEEIMKYLKQHTTGTDQDAFHAQTFIAQFMDDPIAVWLAEGLVMKDIQIGVAVTTLNNVFGKSFIPKIGIMRGMPCPDDAAGDFICTEKIDGNRRLVFVEKDGTVSIFTRSGHKDSGLPELEAEAKDKLPRGYMYDCECVAEGSYSDNIALRQASASLLNSHSVRTGVKALCFDMLPIAEYNNGQSHMGALGRKTLLASAMGDMESCDRLNEYAAKHDKANNMATNWANSVNALSGCFRLPRPIHFQALPILGIAHCKDDGVALARPIWDAKGEGVMMVAVQSPYEVNPNPRKTLLKIKATQEFVCKCTSVVEGDNKYAGMLGSIEVAYQRRGDPYIYSVKVGSGFPDYLRAEYWQHPENIVGKLVEIESFGESVNAAGSYSLNCPIFRRIVGEVD